MKRKPARPMEKPATTPKAAIKQEKKEGKKHVAAIAQALCSPKGKKK